MGGGNVSQDQTSIICIDLKSFYASVECVERGLNPFKTNLVVADPTRSKSTICLAITPAMKALGIKNRCRIHEIPDCVKYITAMPRMQLYMDYSAKIYEFCGRTAFAQLNAADSARIISGVHGKLLLGSYNIQR